MKRPWMPFYVGDYIAKTSHLSTTEHGAYLLLLFHCWANGSIPTNDEQLARIVRMNGSDWQNIKSVVLAFFLPNGNHKRISEEIEIASKISSRRRAAGALGGRQKQANRLAKGIANG